MRGSIAFAGLLVAVALCADTQPAWAQPTPNKVTTENYLDPNAKPGDATIAIYRYGNWSLDITKWTPSTVRTYRVVPDPNKQGAWLEVAGTSRIYGCTVPNPNVRDKGYYGLKPGDPVPNGWVVDKLPNVSGAVYHWRSELIAAPNGPNAVPQTVATSDVQEVKIP